jgi:hypothetical protein
VLEVEDLLEEMEALQETTEREREKVGRYIAEAIVLGLMGWFGFEEIIVCGWRLDGS